jgi:nucleotide-binding universal stress UspA family protein
MRSVPRPLRTIVAATDGSHAAEHALGAAIALATRDGARLVVCSAVDDTNAIVACADPYGGSGAVLSLQAALEAAEARCAAGVARARAAGVEAREAVVSGWPARAILDVIRSHGADAVVLGTQGKRGLERLVLGSTAAEVVRRSDVPAIVIPAAAAGPDEIRRATLLVALDDAPPSAAAFAFALRFAEPETLLVLCGVVETYGTPERGRLQVWAAQARDAGFAAEIALSHGAPAETIVRVAHERGADAIVLGTHGRHGIDRMVLGSVAEGVICRASVPVIVVRREATGARDAAAADEFIAGTG